MVADPGNKDRRTDLMDDRMARPRVTVLMPVRDGECFLREAVASILEQTYGDFELLVVNDGSTDRTHEILDSYVENRLRVVENTGTPGFVGALNLGLSHARGELIARMDADDISHADRLARQVEFLDTHPHVGLVGANLRPVDKHGAAGAWPPTNVPQVPDLVHWRLLWANCVNHPTVLGRRWVYELLGGYAACSYPAEDYDLWMRALSVTRIANQPEVLLHYRQHEASTSSVAGDAAFKKEEEVRHRVLSDLSGREVPGTVSRVAVDPRLSDVSSRDVLRAAGLIGEVTRRYLRTQVPDSAVQATVRREAGARYARLLTAYPRVAWRALLHRSSPSPAWLALALAAGSSHRVKLSIRRWTERR